jgi:hypothetical protein
MHPLDNPIWKALTTRDAQFAEGTGISRRFIREIGPLGAFAEHGEEGYTSLAELVPLGETVGLFLDAAYEDRPGWTFVVGGPLLQMVWQEGGTQREPANDHRPEILTLGDNDSTEMIELTALNPAHSARVRMNWGRISASAMAASWWQWQASA